MEDILPRKLAEDLREVLAAHRAYAAARVRAIEAREELEAWNREASRARDDYPDEDWEYTEARRKEAGRAEHVAFMAARDALRHLSAVEATYAAREVQAARAGTEAAWIAVQEGGEADTEAMRTSMLASLRYRGALRLMADVDALKLERERGARLGEWPRPASPVAEYVAGWAAAHEWQAEDRRQAVGGPTRAAGGA